MPIRAPQPSVPPITAMQLFYLCSGHAWIMDEALSGAELAPAWMGVRDSLLALYGQRCPGNRPYAWWRLESPTPRVAVVSAHDCPARDTTIREQKGGGLWFGVPGMYCCPRCWHESFESQARYLRRHRLLLPMEESVVPLTLPACDAWAGNRYPDVVPPTPWPLGSALEGCRTLLAAWH